MADIIKSGNDKLEYRSITLQSEINCVLVSDPESEKSAAVMNVGVGTLEDQKSHQGLAHFLEHMLFLGSKKYPSADGYRNFITQRGGSSNAYTDSTNTVFYFTINNDSFKEGLDMFANFFKEPLFTPEFVEKELSAVNSEHEKNRNRDVWRESQLMKNISNPESTYYQQFSSGNNQTLRKPDVYKKVKEFYETKYSANLMNLVLYSHLPLDQMEELAQSIFSDVKNKDLPKFSYAKPAKFYSKAELGKLLLYKSINKITKLQLQFALPSVIEHFRNKPLTIINHLIGHEGEGSLLSALIAKNLAFALSSGFTQLADNATMAVINISLTEEGFSRYEEVVLLVGQYISLLKQGIPESVFEEERIMKKIQFDFQQKTEPINRCLSISSNLAIYPPEFCLSQIYTLQEYKPELYNELLTYFTLDNAIVELSSPDFHDLESIEPIYQSNYTLKPLPQDLIEKFKAPFSEETSGLKLPPVNIFIPKTFDLLPGEKMEFPERFIDSTEGEAFYKHDKTFLSPKVICSYLIKLENHGRVKKQYLSVDIFKNLLEHRLKEFLYLAEMANVGLSLTMNTKGLQLSISSFRDSAQPFVREFAKHLSEFMQLKTDPKFLEELKLDFEMVIKKRKLELDKIIKSDPFRFATSAKSWIFQINVNNVSEYLDVIDDFSFEEYLFYHSQIFRKFSFHGMISGDVNKEFALTLHHTLFDAIRLKNFKELRIEEVTQNRVIKLKKKTTSILNFPITVPSEQNSVSIVSFQGSQDESLRVKFLLISKLIDNIFFEELRTKQQLGYVVWTGTDSYKEVWHYYFLVQSNAVKSDEVTRRIYAVIDVAKQFIEGLSDPDFLMSKSGLISEYKQPFVNIKEEHDFNFDQIIKCAYNFEIKKELIAQLEKTTKKEIQELFNQIFYEDRKVLEISFNPQKDFDHKKEELIERAKKEKSVRIFENEKDLQNHSSLYPDIYASKK